MPRQATLSDADFMQQWADLGAEGLSKKYGYNTRWMYRRRREIEARTGQRIQRGNPTWTMLDVYPDCVNLEVFNGYVLVGSDAHIWPGPATLMWRAFVRFCKDLKPVAVILNGDVLDFAAISRFPPLNWEQVPKPHEEIEAARERLHEVEIAAFKARKIWTIGNHDARFERTLASRAPEYTKIHGVHLKDNFPNWEPAMLAQINGSIVVKHRYKGGEHATYNNVVRSGRTMITGHLHRAEVRPFDDYDGTRWGVDTGCLADTNAKQFAYTEGNPQNVRSGFCVLEFIEGRLLEPALVSKWDDHIVQFRGKLIKL